MAQITYTQTATRIGAAAVKSSLGKVTVLGDTLAWSLFLEGAARSRQNGVEITVIGIDGKVLVGDVGQLADPVPYAINDGVNSKGEPAKGKRVSAADIFSNPKGWMK